ncbi:hypothetical protein CYMTET_12059 [Cymbomonas tetramitiformis]|uniref:Uncharacterized protein n=1 Tax=Cymbomonas tetramitiformis TaxID=36881 RepID=A0AAE0GL10_9CHLO|nr:hypothetical protein CYMTET_12059 [Cymbomonas tetramitiformis]
MEYRYDMGTGGEAGFEYKSEVLDSFLNDSLSVAKRAVYKRSTTGSQLPAVGEDDNGIQINVSRGNGAVREAPGLPTSRRTGTAPRPHMTKPRGGRPPARAEDEDDHRLPELKPRRGTATSGRRRARGGGGGDEGSIISATGTNSKFWSSGDSFAPSAYPTTAVTSRVSSTVIRETMARVEALEAHLAEEKRRRETTESQLQRLKEHLER